PVAVYATDHPTLRRKLRIVGRRIPRSPLQVRLGRVTRPTGWRPLPAILGVVWAWRHDGQADFRKQGNDAVMRLFHALESRGAKPGIELEIHSADKNRKCAWRTS